MTQQKRIFLFGSQITVGGAQRVLLDQAGWFQQQGYDVTAAFYYDKDGVLDAWQQQADFPIRVVSKYQKGQTLKNGIGLLQGFFRLCSLIKKVNPDIIECFTHDANLIGIPAAWLCGVLVRVGTHHCTYQGLTKTKIKFHTWVANSWMCSKIVAVSSMAKQQALDEGIQNEKIEIIANGINPVRIDSRVREQKRVALGLKPDDIFILNVARMVREKSQYFLIDAVKILSENYPQIRTMIAGDGPLRTELEEQVRVTALQDTFWLPGRRSDVPELLNAADIFVLYSEIEGMPLSLMEAMSAKLPVIASEIGANRDLVTNGISGILVPFDSAEKLAAAIGNLIDDETFRKQLGEEAGRVITEQFTVEKSCDAYKRLFMDLLSEKGS